MKVQAQFLQISFHLFGFVDIYKQVEHAALPFVVIVE